MKWEKENEKKLLIERGLDIFLKEWGGGRNGKKKRDRNKGKKGE